MVALTFHMPKSCFNETFHDHFGHKLLAKHSILSVIFILLSNFYDLPDYGQISLRFYRENAESPGFTLKFYIERYEITQCCSESTQ